MNTRQHSHTPSFLLSPCENTGQDGLLSMVYTFVLQLTPTHTYRGPFLSSRAGSRAPPLRLRTPTLIHRKLHPNQVSPLLAGGSAAPSLMNMCSSLSRERRGWEGDRNTHRRSICSCFTRRLVYGRNTHSYGQQRTPQRGVSRGCIRGPIERLGRRPFGVGGACVPTMFSFGHCIRR